MRGMFNGASAFNQPLSFNTSRVTDMSSMFGDGYEIKRRRSTSR